MSTVPVPAASAPAAPTAAPADLLPAGIEIFRAGRHTDDAGRVHEFSAADVHRMAQAYDRAEREAPLCVGHPSHDLPAYGFVKSLAVNAAGRLTMDAHQVAPQFAEMVKAGRFKKRSAAFYTPQHPNNPVPGAWYLRHVAFLGAQPPAIAGLADIQFADGGAGLVAFSENADAPDADPLSTPLPPTAEATNPITPTNPQKEPSPMPTDNTPANADEVADLKRKLQAAQDAESAIKAELALSNGKLAAAEQQSAAFAERQHAERIASFTAFAQAQIEGGRLLPKDKLLAVTALDVLSEAQPVEFSEGNTTRKESLAAWLQARIAATAPTVKFGEFAPGSLSASIAVQPGAAAGQSDADIDRAAKAYAAQNKVSYAEAVSAVVSFTA